jgi:AraC family transcriptional regulator, exoenzyme S synthesis regulatory protein ExsA
VIINYIEILKNNPEYFKQFSCNELLFLNYDCPLKVTKATSWSEHNCFYYVLSGQKNFYSNGQVWELKQGSIVFVKRGAWVIEQFFREPFCVVVFMVPDSFISRFIDSYRDQVPLPKVNIADDLVIPLLADEVLQNFCQSILGYFTSKIQPSPALLELKFNELLLNLANNPGNHELIGYLHRVANKEAGGLEFIMENNFLCNLELEHFAKLCNRSLSSFKRDFETIYKTTPGKWLLQKRLEHARKLLVTTRKSLTDILFDSGFENQAHFSRVFKERFNLTPMQYRKNAKNLALNV